jgi:hypothetical protein
MLLLVQGSLWEAFILVQFLNKLLPQNINGFDSLPENLQAFTCIVAGSRKAIFIVFSMNLKTCLSVALQFAALSNSSFCYLLHVTLFSVNTESLGCNTVVGFSHMFDYSWFEMSITCTVH